MNASLLNRRLVKSDFRVASLAAWTAAVIVSLAPGLLAAAGVDYESAALRWAAGAATVAILCAIPAALVRERATGFHPHLVALLILAAAMYAALQMVPLQARLVRALTAGTADAYTAWLAPLSLTAIDMVEAPARIPMTVAPWLTGGAVAVLVLVAAFAWIASTAFTSRQRIGWLLMVLMITGALHAVAGVVQQMGDPQQTLWGVAGDGDQVPFGTFLDRSHAAAMLQIGLACSMGVFAWRMSSVSGFRFDAARIPGEAMRGVFRDPRASLAAVSAVVCAVGLLAAGSRSGIAGAIAGMLAVLGLVSVRRSREAIGLLVGIGLIAATLLISFDLSDALRQRLGASGEGISRPALAPEQLYRWDADITAAKRYFPAGAGSGTSQYARLPYRGAAVPQPRPNAENLWLQWLLETGLAGLVLLLVGLLLIANALRVVRGSGHSVDYGLAVSGTFALVSLAVSQCFGTGATSPAAAIAAAVLLSTVLARSRSIRHDGPLLPAWIRTGLGMPRTPSVGGRSTFAKLAESRPLAAAALGVMAMLLWPAADAFRRREQSVRLQNTFQTLEAQTAAAAEWQQLLDDQNEHLRRGPHDFLVRYQLAETELRSVLDAARIASLTQTLRSHWYQQDAVDAATPTEAIDGASGNGTGGDGTGGGGASGNEGDATGDVAGGDGEGTSDEADGEASDAADQTPVLLAMDAQAMSAAAGPDPLPPSLPAALLRSRSAAIVALQASPLAPRPRFLLASLDFAGGSTEQSRDLLDQLVRLQPHDGQLLYRIGAAAEVAGASKVAVNAWQRALAMHPQYTDQVLRQIAHRGVLTPLQAIPATPEAMEAAARFSIQNPQPDLVLVQKAAEYLGRRLPSGGEEMSDRLRLLAALERLQGNAADALEYERQVVQLNHDDVELRYQFAVALAKAGQVDEAREHAESGRQLAPDDPRFQQLISTLPAAGQDDAPQTASGADADAAIAAEGDTSDGQFGPGVPKGS